MKLSQLHSAVFVTILFLACASFVSAGDIKADIEALEKKWSAALAANDAAALAPLLADDWTNVDTDGSIQTKAEFLESLKSGELKFTSCTLGKINVRVYGDTAVVVGEDASKGTNGGEAFDEKGIFTDVWVKKGDAWVCVATQSAVLGGE